jgi:(1->4)-alpha-D-glucan 1-alpha-D-glucosylmutase
VLLSQRPSEWADALTRWTSAMPERLDRATEHLVWQTLVGTWPISEDRATAYLEKATREAKAHTSWTDPDPEYDALVRSYVQRAVAEHGDDVAAFVADLAPAWRSTVLAQKLVQLTMPGVADTYQGTELADLSLVDPDNRRPVDWDRRAVLLAAPDGSLDGDKLRVVSTALRLRRDHPEWFLQGATYQGLEADPGTLAFCRSGRVVTVVPLRGGDAGPVALPDGDWTELLPGLPVRLLVRA